MIQMLGFSIRAISARINTILGTHITNSMIRLIMMSTQPPKYPAIAPTITPIAAAIPVETNPTSRAIRVPWTMLANTSTPLDVPTIEP